MTDTRTPAAQDMEDRGIDASIADDRRTISITVADLIRQARNVPGMEYMQSHNDDKLRITNESAFALSILGALEHADPDHRASLLYKLIDDAIELALEKNWPGFVAKGEAA